MGYIQLFAESQKGLTGPDKYVQLDLYEEEPIKITKSIQTVEDPQTVTSSFSRTFRIPHTSPNGLFMEAVFNVNSVDFDPTIKSLAYINVDGAYFISGNIRLQSVYRNDKEGKIEYEIIFMGETSTFASVVGPKLLSELDISELTHDYIWPNINLSWTKSLLGGAIVYPLTEWGYNYGGDQKNEVPTQTTLAVYDATTSIKGFTNSFNKLALNQFKPYISVKYLWDRIFREAGFTYQSNFLGPMLSKVTEDIEITGDLFNSLYMVSTDKDTSSFELQDFLEFGAYFSFRSDRILAGNWTKAPLRGIIVDTSNNYNSKDASFTVPKDGTININANGFKYSGTPNTGSTTAGQLELGVAIQPLVGPAVVWAFTGFTQPGDPNIYSDSAFTNTNFPFTLTVTKGDILTFEVLQDFPAWRTGPTFPFYLLGGTWGGTMSGLIDPKGLLPAQYKQMEFIKGINDRFKLMWEPDLQNPRNFKIEPWVDWVKGGTGRDWTDKLNENQDIKIDPLFYSYPRQYNFKDSSEADIFNDFYQKENKQTFGQLNVNSDIELITGTEELSSMFAPFPIAPLLNSDVFLIPHLSKQTPTQIQPIQVKPRICFYNGIAEIPAGITGFYLTDPFSTVQTTYPLASNFYNGPAAKGGTNGYVQDFNEQSFDLNWANVKQFWDENAVGFDGVTELTAYNLYWKSWYDMTYDPYSRIMEATFAIDTNDFTTLQFNDKIFVKDAWWYPLEIRDFVLGQQQNVRVKLLKLGSVGTTVNGQIPDQFCKYEGLCFGNNVCEACCCLGPAVVTIWTQRDENGDCVSPLEALLFYQDSNGQIPAAPGFYLYGGQVIEIGSFGAVVSYAVCDACDCNQTGLTEHTDVCFGTTFCDACCCLTGTLTIWSNGLTLDTSTHLYSSSIGGALTPGGFYAKDGQVYQVGPDGSTILIIGNCDLGCNCNPFEGPFILGGYYDGGTNEQKACCIQGTTGNIGIRSYWIDDTVFETATFIGVGPNTDYPFGTTGQGYTGPVGVSDGEFYKSVQGGTVSSTGNCDYSTPCNGRTNDVKFYTNFEAGRYFYTSVEHTISFNGIDTFWAGTGSAYQISSPSSTNAPATGSVYYDPNSYISFTTVVTAEIPGDVGTMTITRITEGATAFTDSIPVPGTYTLIPQIAGTGSSYFNFSITT